MSNPIRDQLQMHDKINGITIGLNHETFDTRATFATVRIHRYSEREAQYMRSNGVKSQPLPVPAGYPEYMLAVRLALYDKLRLRDVI
jgi:hypothetical protein